MEYAQQQQKRRKEKASTLQTQVCAAVLMSLLLLRSFSSPKTNLASDFPQADDGHLI
jgi:hypothetical protein